MGAFSFAFHLLVKAGLLNRENFGGSYAGSIGMTDGGGKQSKGAEVQHTAKERGGSGGKVSQNSSWVRN